MIVDYLLSRQLLRLQSIHFNKRRGDFYRFRVRERPPPPFHPTRTLHHKLRKLLLTSGANGLVIVGKTAMKQKPVNPRWRGYFDVKYHHFLDYRREFILTYVITILAIQLLNVFVKEVRLLLWSYHHRRRIAWMNYLIFSSNH